MKAFLKVTGVIIVGFALQACSHAAIDKQIEDKIAQEASVKDRAGLIAESNHVIEKDTDLTSEQKAKLVSVRDLTHTKTDEVVAASNKLKAILIKDVLSEHYDEAEIKAIKDRLQSLQVQRLAILYGALDEVNSILGRSKAEKHQWIANEFFDHGGSSFH
jgi:hypothetical protein